MDGRVVMRSAISPQELMKATQEIRLGEIKLVKTSMPGKNQKLHVPESQVHGVLDIIQVMIL
jgi:hypothetical protein